MTPSFACLNRVGLLSLLHRCVCSPLVFISFFAFLNPESAKASPRTGTESLRSNLYLLNISDNSTILADGVLTEYNSAYHDAITLEDAYKFTNITENLGMTRYGITLSVERRPIIVSNDTVYFKLWKTTQRYYLFEFIPTNLYHPGMQAVLQDSYLGTNTPVSLISPTTVTFSVNSNAASSNISRFRIIYSTVASPSPLPVTFTSVSAFDSHSSVHIDWKVENELNISGYTTEHSTDGRNFKPVGEIAVKGLNNLFNAYSYTHATPLAGNNFYRVRSNDKDGSQKYSQIVKVTMGTNRIGSFTVYPNPVSGRLIKVQFTNEIPGVCNIRLTNGCGQTMYSLRLNITSINGSQGLVLDKDVVPGIYQMEIQRADGRKDIRKLIFQ